MSDDINPRISVLDADQCDCSSAHPHLDEFVAHNATVHFEAMSEAQFWMSVTLPDGRIWGINCGAVSDAARGYCDIEAIA